MFITPKNFSQPTHRALSSKAAPPTKSAATDVPTETVEISDAAPAAERKSSAGKLARVGALVALGVAALGASGCAVTSVGYGPYGYSQSTVGITPNGTIYTQESHTGPYGSHTETYRTGPYGTEHYESHEGWRGGGQRYERVGPGGYQQHQEHHHHAPWWQW